MADNYLERQYDDYQRRKAAEQQARRVAWQKRLRQYKEKLRAERQAAVSVAAGDGAGRDETAENRLVAAVGRYDVAAGQAVTVPKRDETAAGQAVAAVGRDDVAAGCCR